MENSVSQINEAAPWETLREFLDGGDRPSAESLLGCLPPEQSVRVLFRLSADDQQRLLAMISPDCAAELLDDIPDSHAADLLGEMEPGSVTVIKGLFCFFACLSCIVTPRSHSDIDRP
jgi:magnesium transporter